MALSEIQTYESIVLLRSTMSFFLTIDLNSQLWLGLISCSKLYGEIIEIRACKIQHATF